MVKFLFVCIVCVFTGSTWGQTKKTIPQKKGATANKTISKQVPAKTAGKKPIAKKPVVKKPMEKPIPISKERLVEITTNFGTMVARLYDSTPLHRDNFIKLVETGFYDSLLFHRVIEGFMIQGGDPSSKNAPPDQPLGMGSAPGERIPAEFKPALFHKKGALSAARDNNPEKASSNCQFYIVQGRTYTAIELEDVFLKRVHSSNPAFQYSESQKEAYKTIGGTPFLDQGYTVFGEIISGMEVIDQIARTPKGMGDRPLQNVTMKMRLLN